MTIRERRSGSPAVTRFLRRGRVLLASITLFAFATTTLSPFAALAQMSTPAARGPLPYEAAATPGEVVALAEQRYRTDMAEARRALNEFYGQAVDVTDGAPDEPALRDDAETARGKTDPGAQVAAPPVTDLKRPVDAAGGHAAAQGLPSADRSLVTGKTISVPKGEGTVEGMGESFSAQLSTGIATFSVPFSLPDARGDVGVGLGLSYGSSGGFGLAGVGWSMPVPFIARQTDRGTPGYDDRDHWHAGQDRFVFNGGQELIPVCVVGGDLSCPGAISIYTGSTTDQNEQMPPWAAKHQYFRARVEGEFLRFFWSPDHATWRIQAKSGVTMELGVPLDGTGDRNALEENPERRDPRRPEIFRWWLARQYDLHGAANPASGNPAPVNVVRYRYRNDRGDGGTAYLTDIYDTPPAAGAATAPLSQYAHHTRLHYEDRSDPSHSYRSGWRMDQRLRLSGVDVTSKSFAGAVSSSRVLLRRYHLLYEAGYHVSLLSALVVEGRCGGTAPGEPQVMEDDQESLPGLTGCPTLPPMRFEYSHVDGKLAGGNTASAAIEGYEPFDEQVRTIEGSPPHSLDEADTVLHDVDSDALPDILVTAPALFGGKHGVFFNGSDGVATELTASTIGIDPVLGANSTTLTLGNANVVPLDVDGDATADLVHMPLTRRYAIYRPVKTSGAWWWQGREVATADGLNPSIDFGRDATSLKVVDVDFDGLVDVVRTTGTEMQTYFSLGRFPGGDGRFGHGEWTGADAAILSADPVRTCLPWSGTAVSFEDKDVSLADMNGDGIVDIVRLRRGEVRYWPGRGNGFWGTGRRDDCAAGGFGQDRDVAMGKSPYYSDLQGDSLRLDDVNGDGLSDLVQIRNNDVDVWLNVDGEGWTTGYTLEGTPPSPAFANRVRLTDVNGSGTPDILWGDANRYRYIDLAGGKRPWLMTRVSNGLGKTTDLEYRSSTDEMLAAKQARAPWSRGMPMVSHVLKKLTVSNNLVVAGHPANQDVTEYTYADPVYDGLQREFRGFARASSRRVGDANSPAETAESRFLLGECVDETPDDTNECTPGERWRDNPREALKGLPYVTERRSDASVYHSTATTKYELRTLYAGLDGREVRFAFAKGASTELYDVAAFTASTSTVQVTVADAPGADLVMAVPRRSSGGSATLEEESVVDYYGNSDTSVDKGCVAGAECTQFTEETLTEVSEVALVDTPSSPSRWVFRTKHTETRGAPAFHTQAYNATDHVYDGFGRLLQEHVTLMGTVELDRLQADTAYFPPRSAGTTAPASIHVATYGYDSFGNVISESGRNMRCRTVAYDTQYAELATSEASHTAKNLNGASALVGAGCTGTPLTSTAAYDRGLGEATLVTDVTGQPTRVDYDEFGRVVELHRPHATTPNTNTPGSVLIEYQLPGPQNPNHSIVHVRAQDGLNTSVSQYLESRAYVDGLGRTFLTLNEGYGRADGIVSGLTVFNDKSGIEKVYLDHATPAGAYDVASAPGVVFAKKTYDAFERVVRTQDFDETITLETTYHALATDSADAEDINQGGAHEGTPLTELRDGHGRVVKTTERFEVSSVPDARITQLQYLPTGAVEVVRTYAQSAPGAQLTRYLVYDTLGRLVLNVEPNSSSSYTLAPLPNLNATNQASYPATLKAWRYRYDDAGDLVGVSDARTCGVNFFYDGLGRLLMEDEFRCATQHAPYTTPVLNASSVPTSGVEVAYEYDALSTAPKPTGWTPPAGFMKGRLVRIRDLGAHTLYWYDGRGNLLDTAVQPARAGATAVNALATRYTTTAPWYRQGVTYDAADRPRSEATGATAALLLGTGSESKVFTSYDERGQVSTVSSSYGPLVAGTTRDPDGFVTEITYGDLAATKTDFEPDVRRRISTVMTYRGPPASGWPVGWETADPNTFQTTLEHQHFVYDDVSNPTEIQDLRTPAEWPAGAKPAHRLMSYDDFYRVSGVTYQYQGTSGALDAWTSPFADEAASYAAVPPPGNPQSVMDPRRTSPSPHMAYPTRMSSQSFTYDWKGNTTATGDNLSGFYDRSLGTILNGTAAAGPYRMTRAEITSGAWSGKLTVQYDLAGNVTRMDVARNGTTCIVTSRRANARCNQVFQYEWDERNRLTRARRWDPLTLNPDVPPTMAASATVVDLRYRYDSGDNRIIKSSKDVVFANVERHTVYVFDSLELRRAAYGTPTANEYVRNEMTEVPYLFAHGVRLARVVYDNTVPASNPSALHVFFELGDHLGSASTVLDMATGELVEKASFSAYGSTESDYRPDRWGAFREDHRFTGKEEDIEVGLVYFGKRFYSANLNRWMTPDPLAVHDVGKGDLNLYAYVSGRALRAIDPIGLDGEDWGGRALGWINNSGVLSNLGNRGEAMWQGGAALVDTVRQEGVGAAAKVMVRSAVQGAAHLATDTAGAVGDIAHEVTHYKGPASMKKISSRATDVVLNAADAVTLVAGGVGMVKSVGNVGKGLAKTAKGLAKEIPGPTCRGGACKAAPGCFVAGTLVRTITGYVPIEEIEAGTWVLSLSDSAEGPNTWRQVVRTIPRPKSEVLSLTLEGDGGARAVLGVTFEHPLWVEEQGWVGAGDLVPGNRVWSLERGWLRVVAVMLQPRLEQVYNFEVDVDHTYAVGELAAWVHNLPCDGGKGVNLNNNSAVSDFGIYEIHIAGKLHKIGKADLSRTTKATGLPTRLHTQLRQLKAGQGKGKKVGGKVVDKLGQTTTAEAKAAETARLNAVYKETGAVPDGNKKSFKP